MNKNIPNAEIGVFGGSGFYSLFDNCLSFEIDTPYGKPSAEITIGEIAGRMVAFLPRHGSHHQYPPHQIPYRANIWALKQLGVSRIISPCAVGSLNPKVKPGHFVILDQFIDRTKNRQDTFYDGPETVHISGDNPYCPQIRQLVVSICRKLKIKVHPQGTVVVVNGPRFSTAAESMYYTNLGCEVINMTQYPEVVLAREQEICFLGIALVTDWDIGLAAGGKVKAVEVADVIKVFNNNLAKSRQLIYEIIKQIPATRECPCKNALTGARITA